MNNDRSSEIVSNSDNEAQNSIAKSDRITILAKADITQFPTL